jgi:AraC-like DNA-binding protein
MKTTSLTGCPYATFRPKHLPSGSIPLGARSVGRHRVARNWRDAVFTVNHVVCLWTIAGQGRVAIDGKPLSCPVNHLAILLPGMEQRLFSTSREWEYCWWTMDGPEVTNLITAFGLHARTYRAGPPPIESIEALIEVIQRPDHGSEFEASGIAYSLLAHAARASQLSQLSEEDLLVRAARELLQDHWQNSALGVSQIADRLGVNRAVLSRRFRAETGVTVIDYLTGMRIQAAISLLQESGKTVAEIGRHCGYYDPSYFTRAFRKRMGTSPSTFRGKGE